jgi:integrase
MTNPFQIKMLKQPDGERIPIVLRRSTGMPFNPINEYLLYYLRSGSASRTMEKYARTIALLFWWGEIHRIDIMDRLLSGEGFSTDQILMSLKDFLRKNLAEGGTEVVDPNTFAGRALVIKNFVTDHMTSAISRLGSNDPRIDRIAAKFAALKNAFDRLEEGCFYPEPRYALSDGELDFLLDIANPQSLANPWKPRCRARNQLIVLILSSIPMRIGELGNLRVADCEINSPIPGVRIVRNPDDPEDPRKIKPTPKTAERLYPVESWLARAVDDYIEKERFRIPNSHKTPFLFLNVDNGQPLSLRQFDRIFEQISRRHRGRFKSMFPHILRHTVLTRIMDGLRARGFDDKSIVGHLKAMAGWGTDNSGTYTAASIERECHFQLREHQRRLYSRNEDIPL